MRVSKRWHQVALMPVLWQNVDILCPRKSRTHPIPGTLLQLFEASATSLRTLKFQVCHYITDMDLLIKILGSSYSSGLEHFEVLEGPDDCREANWNEVFKSTMPRAVPSMSSLQTLVLYDGFPITCGGLEALMATATNICTVDVQNLRCPKVPERVLDWPPHLHCLRALSLSSDDTVPYSTTSALNLVSFYLMD
jgi:hypothetical protein